MVKKPARMPKKEAARPTVATASAKTSLKPLMWVMMFTLVMLVLPSIVMVAVIGMLPTVVAAIIDKTPKKYAAWSVGAMNLAGVFPAIQELWMGDTTIKQAMAMLSNPFELVVMYAAAMFGWMIYMAIPPVVRSLMSVMAQHRTAQLRSEQRTLIGEWGAGIADQALFDS